MSEPKKHPAAATRAPTFYAIVAIKLMKGIILLAVGFVLLRLVGQDLDMRFDQFLRWVHLDPERKFFAELGNKLQRISPANIKGVGIGTLLYSLFSLVEGGGLIFRLRWIGWIVIGESVFFIPIEIYDLMRRFSGVVFCILVVNVVIVWYLLKNKERLFKHR